MKESVLKFIKNSRISEWYYIIVTAGYFLTLFIGGMRPGVAATALMLLIAAELFVYKEFTVKHTVDVLVLVYLAYHCVSVIWLTKAGYPLSVFINEFTASVLVMIFYFVGKSAGKRTGIWYRNFLIAMLMLSVIGLVLYIAAPQFYIEWNYEWSYISKADASTMRVRMNSVVGSTILSFMMIAGMLASAYFLAPSPEDNLMSKGAFARSRNRIWWSIINIALCLLVAIMSNQRSGLVAAALVIVYVNYLLVFQLEIIPKKYFVIEIIAVAVALAGLCVVKLDYVLKFWWRIASLPSAVSERSEQWIAAVNNMYSTWLGNGIGANGHKALGVEGAHIIADGGLIKIYCEDGVLGFSVFVFMLILTFKKGLSNIRKYFTEIGIIAVALLQSIGSNILAFQLCTPIFWFAIGRICAGEDEA